MSWFCVIHSIYLVSSIFVSVKIEYDTPLNHSKNRREIQRLRAAGDNAANRSADLESQLTSLLAENARLVAETEELGDERTRLMVALGRARGDAETASKDAETCQQKAAQLQTAATAALADKDRLEREVGDLKWQLERLRKEQADDAPAKDELQRQLQAARTEVERCDRLRRCRSLLKSNAQILHVD